MKKIFLAMALLLLTACGDPYSVYDTWVPKNNIGVKGFEIEISKNSMTISADGHEEEILIQIEQNKNNPKLWRFTDTGVIWSLIKFIDEDTIEIEGFGTFVRD